MLEKLIDYLICEKMDHKKYEELAEEANDQTLKDILYMLSNEEKKHYNILKEYVANKMGNS